MMTCLFGAMTSFWGLFVARLGVGAGEAPLNACAMPLISDLFPKERLGRALGVYMLGASIGAGLTGLVGGHFLPQISADTNIAIAGVDFRPWQVLFLGLGLFGLFVALLTLLISDPPRRDMAVPHGATPAVVPLRDVGRHVWRHRLAYAVVIWPVAASAMMVFGASSWIPSFFIRSYGLTVEQAGGFIRSWGAISLACGMLGVLIGGWLTDRLARRHTDGYARALACGAALALPGYGFFTLAPTPDLAVMLFALAPIGAGIMQAAGATAMMMLTPNRMRSLVAAIFFLIVTMIGSLIGPTLIAALTDYAFRDEGALRYSIASVATIGLGSGLLLIALARKSYRQSVEELARVEGL